MDVRSSVSLKHRFALAPLCLKAISDKRNNLRNSIILNHRIVILVLLLASLSGCINTETVVHLLPDGSGQIVERTLFSRQFIEQMTAMFKGIGEQLGGNNADSKTSKGLDLFSEDSARKKATQYGEGVSLVSSKKISDENWEGLESVYAFKEISKVHLSERHQPSDTPESDSPNSGKATQTTFGFSRLPNGNSLLTVFTPPVEKRNKTEVRSNSEKDSEDTPNPRISSNRTQELETLKKTFEGFRIVSAIEVQGTVVQTNIPYQSGSRLTLLEIDFSQLLGNEAQLKEIQALRPKTLEEAKGLLKEFKGFKFPLDSRMQVEFRGQ